MLPKLALIGIGHWGKNLARNFNKLGILHTVCELDPKLREAYAKEYPDIVFTSSYEEILANDDISMVAIATPAETHGKLIKSALEAGKDVFVEKPLCLDVYEGKKLVQLAKETNRILMIGHLLQYHPCVQKIQEMLSEGKIGTLISATSRRLSCGKVRQHENVLWSFAPHDISVILSLFKDVPDAVYVFDNSKAFGGLADSVSLNLRFANGTTASVEASWMHPFKEQVMVITGSLGSLVFDDTKEWSQKLAYYPNMISTGGSQRLTVTKTAPQFIDIEQSEPLLCECRHFVECCQKRCSAKTSGGEGLAVLNVLERAQKALKDAMVFPEPYFVHPTAVVSEEASVGNGSKVWHYSHVMAGAIVGEECNIGQNVFIANDAKVGNRVKIQNNVSVYKGMICEDDVFLGPSAVFTNIDRPRSAVCKRDQYATTMIRKGATIGANATIVCGNEIGAYAFVGAGSVVTRPIKPYALVVGNPAKQIGWLSKAGEKLDLPLSTEIGNALEVICPVTQEKYVLEGDTLYCASEEVLEV